MAVRPERREVYYSGHVQGVGFRYTAASLAASLDVSGFVRNLSDGRVQLVVEGLPREVDRLLADIADVQAGRIIDVEANVAPATGQFQSFEIRR